MRACCQPNTRGFRGVWMISVGAVLDVRNHSIASQRMVCSMPFLAFTRACALCFWMVMTAHHVNTVPQFSSLPGCSCPVLRASPRAARDKLLKALWYPSHRCFLCVCEQVLSCRFAVFFSPACKSQSWAWLPGPILTFVAQVSECVQHAQCAEYGAVTSGRKIKFFWSILRVGSIETLLALPNDLHCGIFCKLL